MQNPYEATNQGETECRECGEVAIVELMIQGHAAPQALCGQCLDDTVTMCPGCQATIYQRDGTRIYASANLYCPRCVKEHPVAAADLARSHRMDIQRDDPRRI